MPRKRLELSGTNLTLEDSLLVAEGRFEVAISDSARELVKECRDRIMTRAKSGTELIYGFNMGFGQHQDVQVDEGRMDQLQVNLIRSHAISFGEPACREIVRMAMLFRVNALIKGFSGIRIDVVDKIVEFLNNDVCPYVPVIGSLGASGDLSPLSHIALALIGEGDCLVDGSDGPERVSTRDILAQKNIKPIELKAKEGLALNNGMQFTTASLVYLVSRLNKQMTLSLSLAAAMSEIMLASDNPFMPEVQDARPYDGQVMAARMLHRCFEDSGILLCHKSAKYDKNTQDPYSSRCLPQVFGSFFQAIIDTKAKLEIEINSATDNPLVFNDQVVSGGNFHGMPIALVAANLFNAFCAAVKISDALVARIVDKDKNRIGSSCLIASSADHQTSSGMMILEYSHHAIVNLIMSGNNNAFLFASTSASCQEDHVSHAPTVTLNLEQASQHFDYLLALQSAMVAQGYFVLSEIEADWKQKGKIDSNYSLIPGKIGQALKEEIEKYFKPVTQDRYMQPEVMSIHKELILTDRLLEIVTSILG